MPERLDRAETLILLRIPPFLGPSPVIGGPSLVDRELLPGLPLADDKSGPLLRFATLWLLESIIARPEALMLRFIPLRQGPSPVMGGPSVDLALLKLSPPLLRLVAVAL